MPRLNLPRRASPPQPLPSPARAAPLPGHHDPCTLGAPRTPARPGWCAVAGLLLGLTTLSAVPAQAQWVVTETVDCAPGLTTVCSVAVGGTAKGTLHHRADSTLDEDGWAVMLEEGQTYQIDLKGIDTGDGLLPDPWLLLFDSGDNFLTENVRGGVGRNARITYTVPRDQGGTFYLTAASDLLPEESGLLHTYTLTVVNTANTAPMGRPTISGTAQVGKVLTAGTTTITDADGLTSPNFIYQWVRVDGETETDIAAATSSTYTLVAADVGTRITVRVCFTDDGRSAEGPLTSDATAVVVAPAFSVADARAEEGDVLAFVVTLSPAASETVTVTYATSVESGDTATSATLTFAANETRKTIRVITLEDTVFEEDETFTLTLSNVQSTGLVLIADETATGTIDADIFDELNDCQDGAAFVTRCAMDHADLSSGSIASATDLDAWSVILDPGKTYQIDVRGAGDPGGDNPGTLADPRVVLIEWDYDEQTGAFTPDQRASHDNVSPTNKNARLTYTHHPADQLQRVFYVVIAGVSGGTGTYTVIVRDVTPADRETNNCAANHNTACNLAVGGTVTGSLSTAQDTDTWRVPLKSDKTYQVDVRGADSTGGTLPDPTLQLMSYDSNTTGLVQVAAADNGGTGEDARLTHAVLPGQGGNYYITIGGNGATGSYTLTVIEVAAVPSASQREESPLTAEFRNMPAKHDGSTPFTFDAIFNSDIGISYATLRDHSFTVTNGKVTRARRNNGQSDRWEITVTPSGNEAVTITLPGNRDCGTTAAICTKEDHPVQLSNSPSATVKGPSASEGDPPSDPLTASLSGVPGEHTGESFTFGLTFSEDVAGLSYKTLRDSAFSVTNGQVTRARRRTQGSNQGWTITVEPDSHAAVTIRLPSESVETSDGRGLESAVSATVAGPVGIAVADARVEEAVGAVLAFAVTLDRAATGTLTVDYATSDGSAQADVDYASTSGTLSFKAGESSKTIEVAVLDDSHDEGEETLTLRLSNPSGGRLTDASATGTIENRDLLPKALLARFGRAAAVHVVEQVQERIEARRETGIEAQFAGRQLRPDMARKMAAEFLNRLAPSAGMNRVGAGVPHPMSSSPVAGSGLIVAPMGTADGLGGPAGPMGSGDGLHGGLDPLGHFGRGLGGGNLLTGSAFVMNHETRRGGILSFWSRGAQSQFAGRDGKLSLDGRVRTTMFGADYAKGPLITGLSLSHSRGLGGYSGVSAGELTSSVTGLYPWLGYKVSDRITLWGVTGYGKGALTLTPGAGTALRSGLSMAMTAGGMRGELADSVVGGFGLAFKADAL